MNKFDSYYKQIVTQAWMDQAFDWVEEADNDFAIDQNLSGLLTEIDGGSSEWDAQPTTPASMAIEIQNGPHRAYDKLGRRIYFASAVESIDCSVDEYGVSTTVTGAANERVISVFARFKRNLTDPEVDGSSVLVYTRQLEDAELFVRQGAEAAAGAAVAPALLGNALLVCDITLAFGQTSIQLVHIDTTRTEWFGSIPGLSVYGDVIVPNIKAGIEDLWNALDTVASGGGPFSFTSTWFGGSAVDGGAPATVAQALDAIVSDLAAATGSSLIGTSDVTTTYVSWASQSISGALSALATAVDGHIGGAAPNHPATAITYNDATYSWGTPSTVQEAIDDIEDVLTTQATNKGVDLIGSKSVSATNGGQDALVNDILGAHIEEMMGWINASPRVNRNELIPRDHDSTKYWQLPSSMVGNARPGHGAGTLTKEMFFARTGPTVGLSKQPTGFMNWHPGTTGVDFTFVCPGYLPQENKMLPFFVGNNYPGVIYFDPENNVAQSLFTGVWPSYPASLPYMVRCDGEKTYVACYSSATQEIRLLRFDTATETLEANQYFGATVKRVPGEWFRNNMILTDDAVYLTIDSPAGASTPILGVKKDDFSIWAIGGGNLPAATTGYADGGLCGVVGVCRYAWWNVSGGGLANTGYICECVLDYSGAPAIVASIGSIHSTPYQIGEHISDIKFDGVYTWYLDYNNRALITCYEIETAAGILYIDRWEGTWLNDYLRATSHYQFLAFDGQNLYWVGLEDGHDRIVLSQVDCRRTIYDAVSPGFTNMAQTPIFVSEPDFPSRPSARSTVGRIACAGGIIAILTDDDPNDEVFLLYDASAINANL